MPKKSSYRKTVRKSSKRCGTNKHRNKTTKRCRCRKVCA